MTVLVFLVDTSASMAQSSYMGLTYLDHARSLVANIRKAREQMKAADRYMLVTAEEYPRCVKAGYRETSQVFEQSVNNLRAHGKYHMGQAVLNALRYVNTQRAAYGVDQFGMGRWFSMNNDNVVVITITDTSGASSLAPDFPLVYSGRAPPAGDFMEEAFRWDQRIFSVVLRLRGDHRPVDSADPLRRIEPVQDDSPMDRLCRQTGGRSWRLDAHDQVSPFVQQFMGAMTFNGSNIRFETFVVQRNGQVELGGDSEREKQTLAAKLEKRPLSMIFMKRGTVQTVHWPIPESFSPQSLLQSKKLPFRKGHPTVYIQPQPVDTNHCFLEFPFDRYDVEPGPLTEFILEYMVDKSNAQMHLGWLVYVQNSSRSEGLGKPFGYLKAATNLQAVSLYVLPYNYHAILPLLEEGKNTDIRNTPAFRDKLVRYLQQVPSYYLPYLKRAFRRIQIPPEFYDQYCSINPYNDEIVLALQSLKISAREEMDGVNAQIQQQNVAVPVGMGPVVVSLERISAAPRREHISRFQWEMDCGEQGESFLHCDRRKDVINLESEDVKNERALKADPEPNTKLTLREATIKGRESAFRNPLVIRRSCLISTLSTFYENFRQAVSDRSIHWLQGGMPGSVIRLQNAADIHNQPVLTMGNYEEYIKSLSNAGWRPREVQPEERTTPQQQGFGNPFKQKITNVGIDEVIETPTTGASTKDSSRREKGVKHDRQHRKRKTGPLAPTALKAWREKRRTISERSSCVSDVSYISEIADNDLEPSQQQQCLITESVEVNGKLLTSGGEGSSKLINGSKRPCGDESTTERGDKISPVKKPRKELNGALQENEKNIKRLEPAELRERIVEVIALVRQQPGGETLRDSVVRWVGRVATAVEDKHRLFVHAAMMADRFKRHALANALRKVAEKEIQGR